MIPYDDIPEQLVITHPRHRSIRQLQGGHEARQTKWRPEWTPFMLTEHAAGRTAAAIATELNVTKETVLHHLREELT